MSAATPIPVPPPPAPPAGRGSRVRTVSRRTAARALGWAALGFTAGDLGLAALAETYPRVRDPLYGDKFVKLRRRVAVTPRPFTVVMLGSSRTGMAFHGLRAEAALRSEGQPVAAFNFGIPSAGPVTHLVYLNRMLAAGVTPDVLLVEVLPPMLGAGPDAPRERHWLRGDRLTGGEVDTVARFGFDEPKVRGEWRRTVLVPWFALRMPLVGRFGPSWLPDTVRPVYEWSKGSDECGWGTPQKSVVTPEERAYWTNRTRQEYASAAAALSLGGPAVAALQELLTVCRDRGIAARLVLLPEGSAFRDLYPPAVRDRTAAALSALTTESAVPLIDASTWLPDDLFPDAHHMIAAGAEAFTDRLTREVLLPLARARGLPTP